MDTHLYIPTMNGGNLTPKHWKSASGHRHGTRAPLMPDSFAKRRVYSISGSQNTRIIFLVDTGDNFVEATIHPCTFGEPKAPST